jgi:hypothetical protein
LKTVLLELETVVNCRLLVLCLDSDVPDLVVLQDSMETLKELLMTLPSGLVALSSSVGKPSGPMVRGAG